MAGTKHRVDRLKEFSDIAKRDDADRAEAKRIDAGGVALQSRANLLSDHRGHHPSAPGAILDSQILLVALLLPLHLIPGSQRIRRYPAR